MYTSLPFLLLLCFLSPAFSNTILESGESDFYSIHKSQEGNEIDVDISDLKGTILSSEKILLQNDQFQKYSWKQFQTGETVELELKTNKLHFKSPDKEKTINLPFDEFISFILLIVLKNPSSLIYLI